MDTKWIDELSPEHREKMQELTEAMRGEFYTSIESDNHKAPVKDLEDIKDDALTALKWCLNHSESPTIKSRVAMWTYDKLLDQGKATKDPLVELMAGIENARKSQVDADTV